MRALLTPCLQRELGLVMFRPGRELLPMFTAGRVLISNEPDFMKGLPAGGMADTSQALADDPALLEFFTDARVIAAAGGVGSLESWLMVRADTCQWPTADYHNPNMTLQRYGVGSVRLCWHHDGILRQMTSPRLEEIANRNLAEWILDKARIAFMFPEHHQITMPELCWWAVLNEVIQAMPEGPARRVLKWPAPEAIMPVMKEADIQPSVPATSVLEEKAKQVLALKIDPESPESLMLRPKRRRWVNEQYTRWVKSQPCEGCGNPSDDPHHIIGYGQGGMGTKAHDLFVIPLCRRCHDELHRDMRTFEHGHDSQPAMLLRVLDKALAIGIIATGRK
ncbi:DUF968 domain-containing protein [Sodalis sp. RH21]|uniref:DUF968 domain-containing protein n=1 Tax=unclassified Sodalis (in: enterobacteria) TaxID=2636512 RepID=UPI0039B52466